MPYTDSSGVQIPVGTDAFNPTPQFKTWQDKNATYNNRVIVPLDTDRTALATPVLREGLRCYVEATDREWVYDGTSWSMGVLTNLQLDTANSVVQTIMQVGIGKIAGSAVPTLTEAVVFPAPFAAGTTPVVTPSSAGTRASGAFNPAGLGLGVANVANHSNVSPTGFDVTLRNTGGNFGSGVDYYYTWVAVGVPA